MISPYVTAIVKVTNRCNMACDYCFIEPAIFNKTLTGATARRVVRAFLDSDHFRSVDFVWHGGEPLLRSRHFFSRLLDEQTARPTRVAYTNSIQTNATRLDEWLLDFLTAHNVKIGLSLDGPRRLNDCTRRGRGAMSLSAYQATVDAAYRLRERGMYPAAIAVVNRRTVSEPEAIYREFVRLGINLKLNCLTWSGRAAAATSDLAVAPEEYGAFLIKMFDLWFDDPHPSITIEPFRQHIGRILDIPGIQPSCYFSRHCHHHIIGISPSGDMFPCGMFQGEPAFRYGNIRDMAPEEIGQSDLFRQLDSRERRVLKKCRRCAFLDLCYGGCMFHSLKNARIMDAKDYYCASYSMYFEHALRRIHADLSRVQRERFLGREPIRNSVLCSFPGSEG
jgi:uncharacterized protein